MNDNINKNIFQILRDIINKNKNINFQKNKIEETRINNLNHKKFINQKLKE